MKIPYQKSGQDSHQQQIEQSVEAFHSNLINNLLSTATQIFTILLNYIDDLKGLQSDTYIKIRIKGKQKTIWVYVIWKTII